MVLVRDLVKDGNTLIIIEHNLSVISQADWIIDLGLKGEIKAEDYYFRVI